MTLIWDPLVRVSHWTLAACVLSAWLTRHSSGPWHEWFGYGAIFVVAVRMVWGFFGPTHARFSSFVLGPRVTLDYVREMLAFREARFVGHNPIGGWSAVALLMLVSLVGASGWLYTTDAFWGVEWVERVHSMLSDGLWILIGVHVLGVLYASGRHGDNLIAAMFHGRKRGFKAAASTKP
jgi:cytochrome b